MQIISPKNKKNFAEFTSDIDKHELFLLAASIAYTTALALAPFILILLSLASLLGGSLQQELYTQLSANIGNKAAETIQQIMQNAKAHPTLSGFSGIIGFIVLLVSSSAIFTQLRIALNKINEHKAPKKESGVKAFVKEKFMSIGLVFGFAFLAIVSLIISTSMSAFFPSGDGLIWKTVSFISNFLIFSTLFAAMYRFIPSDKLPWKTCFISGLVSAVFYIIGKSLISLYLGKASFESTYGAAGSVIAFLAWVYYTALTLLVSYEFSKNIVLARQNKQKEFPDSSQMARV